MLALSAPVALNSHVWLLVDVLVDEFVATGAGICRCASGWATAMLLIFVHNCV